MNRILRYASENKKKIHIVFIFCVLILISFLLSMKSEYNFFNRGGSHPNDGDVFNCIGWLMTKGWVPYRDIFDHKGLFLYFLQYVGSSINSKNGIWVIECIFLTASVFLCYGIAKKFCGSWSSVFIILLLFARYDTCGYGNCSEEYSILFQLISIAVFLDFFFHHEKYIKENTPLKFLDFRIVLNGLCFACVFFMKPNLCGLWIVFCAVITTLCLYKKWYTPLFRFVLSFSLGFLLIAVPILIYLLKNNCFHEFLYDYFTFNKLYTSNADRVTIKSLVKSFITFSETLPYILSVIILIIEIKKKDRHLLLNITYLLYLIGTLLLITISGQTYPKMEVSILPAFIYPFSTLMHHLENPDWKKTHASVIVISYLILTFVYPSWSSLLINDAGYFYKYINEPENMGFADNEIVKYIKKNTKNDDYISVLGNECRIYLFSDRLPASKYIFMPDPRVDRNMIYEYIEDLKETRPKIIVLSTKEYKDNAKFASDAMYDFLDEYGYKLVMDGEKPVYRLSHPSNQYNSP